MADINLGAEARVVGMGLGENRALHRASGIDVKVARGAIEVAVG